MDKFFLICLLFIFASCTTVDLNKSVTIITPLSSNESSTAATNSCQAPYVVPVTVTYFTTSEVSLKDLLKSDTQLQGIPGL